MINDLLFQETESSTTQKPEEKKIAWKFGRAGNNQGPWSSRPSPNSGFSAWKKEVPTANAGQTEQGDNSKQNDQGYLVWNIGQGNQPGGWTIGKLDCCFLEGFIAFI